MWYVCGVYLVLKGLILSTILRTRGVQSYIKTDRQDSDPLCPLSSVVLKF